MNIGLPLQITLYILVLPIKEVNIFIIARELRLKQKSISKDVDMVADKDFIYFDLVKFNYSTPGEFKR